YVQLTRHKYDVDLVELVSHQESWIQRELFRQHAGSTRREELDFVMERVAQAVREALLIESVAKFVGQGDLDPNEVSAHLGWKGREDPLRHFVPHADDGVDLVHGSRRQLDERPRALGSECEESFRIESLAP